MKIYSEYLHHFINLVDSTVSIKILLLHVRPHPFFSSENLRQRDLNDSWMRFAWIFIKYVRKKHAQNILLWVIFLLIDNIVSWYFSSRISHGNIKMNVIDKKKWLLIFTSFISFNSYFGNILISWWLFILLEFLFRAVLQLIAC